MWNRALKKAELENRDKGTNRRTLHIHMLRKYFSSQMRLKVSRPIVEALMGHEEGLDDAYRRYTEQRMREEYLKGEPYLHVLSSEEFSRLRTHYDGKIAQLQELANGFARENMALKEDVKEMKTKVKELGDAFTKNLSREVQKVIQGLYGEDLESMKDVEKEREEFTRRRREEQQPPVKEK